MPTETLTCWNCGYESLSGAKFCANCGKAQRQACPECGEPLPEGAKFCANCGIPVGKGAKPKVEGGPVLTAETRKVITSVFADLVGSTGLTERLDAEEAREVVGKFYGVVQHAVERNGGMVANLLGDAVLAVFGLPLTHEDDPERAVRAGLDIRDAMPALNDHLQATHGVQLATRVGVNTGEVVAVSGSTFDRDFLVSDAVTTAARIQQTVSPGVVVVGERTHRLTEEVIEYRDLPPLDVKGKAAPLRVWEAIAPRPERPEVRRATAPLVGRHGELGLLGSLYHRSRDEALVVQVTVLGQPGVGKSRLVREFLAEVRDTEPQPLVLRGRSVAFGGQIGYRALIDILSGQAGIMDTDPPETVRAKLGAWLRERLPSHTGLLDGLLLTFGGDEGNKGDPARMQQQLFETWESLLDFLAADRPVILVLEDLHWADEGLLDLVEWLGERIESARLFLISLARPDLRERRPTWGSGGRNSTNIELKPLRQREVEELVTALSSQGLTSEMQRLIAERAEGNPLFVEELVRMLMEGSGPGAAIPDTVQAVLTARIDRLPQDEHRVLQAASVIGRTFWPSAVAPLAGLSEDALIRAMENLIKKEMIVLRPQSSIAGEREYAFRHILTRDVAYGMLPRSQRQRAHGEAARWLESRLEERLEEFVDTLAEHLRVAGDDTVAATYLHRAANKARRLNSNAIAIRLFDQALEAATRAKLAPQEIVLLYRGRGDVNEGVGNYQAALTDYEKGLALARTANDRALEAALEGRVGLVYHRQLRLAEAEPYFRRAAETAREANDRLLLGLSLLDVAQVGWDLGHVGPDDPTLVEGIRLVRDVGDRSALARGLNLLCMAHFSAGDAPPAIAAAKDALAAAQETKDKSREATSLSYLSVVTGFWGQYHDGIRYGQEAVAIAEEIGDKRRIAFTLSFIAQARASLGEWGEALHLLEQAMPLLREYAVVHLPFPLLTLGTLYAELGQAERARTVLSETPTVDTRHPAWQAIKLAGQVSLAHLIGDTRTLHLALDALFQLPVGVFVPDDGVCMLQVGEVLLKENRIDDLRQFLDRVRPSIERFQAPPQLAAMAIMRSHLARHDGDQERALAFLEEALAWSDTCGDVISAIAACELRLKMLRRNEDREALQRLVDRIVSTLPEDLRASFLAVPRLAVLRD